MREKAPRMSNAEADQLMKEVGGEGYAKVAEMDRAFTDLVQRLTHPIEGYQARLAQALDHARLFEGASCVDLYRDRWGQFRTILTVRKEAQPILTALQVRLDGSPWFPEGTDTALWVYPHQRTVSAIPMGAGSETEVVFTTRGPLRGQRWSTAAVVDWLHERGVVALNPKTEAAEIEREIENHKKLAATLTKRKRDLEQAASKKGSAGSKAALRALVRAEKRPILTKR